MLANDPRVAKKSFYAKPDTDSACAVHKIPYLPSSIAYEHFKAYSKYYYAPGMRTNKYFTFIREDRDSTLICNLGLICEFSGHKMHEFQVGYRDYRGKKPENRPISGLHNIFGNLLEIDTYYDLDQDKKYPRVYYLDPYCGRCGGMIQQTYALEYEDE